MFLKNMHFEPWSIYGASMEDDRKINGGARPEKSLTN